MTGDDIEIMAHWTGKPGAFIEALTQLKLINSVDDKFSVHDWEEHNSFAFYAPERSEQARINVSKRWVNHLNTDGNTDGNTPSPSPNPSPKPTPKDMSSLRSDGVSEDAPLFKGNGKPQPPKKPYVPIEERTARTPTQRLVKYWHVRYEQIHQIKYTGDAAKMGGQAATLIKRNSAEELAAGVNFLLSSKEHAQYSPHTWDHFVKNASKYILEAKEANYEPGFFID